MRTARRSIRSNPTPGIRSVGKTKDADGHWRFTLNGEPVFHLGPLDQGWWPDGLHTPPSDEAMTWELEWLKAAGFNMLSASTSRSSRGGIITTAIRSALMVWQDQVSGWPNPPWTRLQPDPVDADWPDEAHEQYLYELEEMIAALGNHPSIVIWVPFNEAWGQHRTVEVGEWTAERGSDTAGERRQRRELPAGRRRRRRPQLPAPEFPVRSGERRAVRRVHQGGRRIRRPRPTGPGPPVGSGHAELGATAACRRTGRSTATAIGSRCKS